MSEAIGGQVAQPSDDVYAEYQELRENRPVSREDEGPWRVARYEDVRHILKAHDAFSSAVSQRVEEDGSQRPSMLFSDPPIHSRLRDLVSRAFTPRQIASQTGAIEERCERLVKRLASEDRGDLVKGLAAPLPVGVIATMLGVEDGDFDTFKRWSDTIFTSIGDILIGTPSEEAVAASEEMNAYFLERIAVLRKRPGTHLLSKLVHVETEDGKLSDAELLMFCVLLLIAVNEPTTSLIVGSARIFHERPETFHLLKQTPELIPGFIEETLRYYSPFKMTIRKATRDVELCGEKISAGDLVLPLIASANRDERVFERASEFILDRNPNPHLAFGLGIHSCLGASLARLEGRIAVASLLEHLDGISIRHFNAAELDGFGVPASIPVELRRAA
jgi:cytochrome P450